MELIKRIDFTRLQHLLARTESSEDAEALASVRRANQLLRDSSMSWGELLLHFIERKLQEQALKDQEASREMDPCKVLEQTLTWLRENGKISDEQYSSMIQSVRMMFRSRDTNFTRRMSKKIRDVFSSATAQLEG